MYYDTTTNQLLTYNGTKWIGSQKQAIIVAASDSTQADRDAADYIANSSNAQTTINTAASSLPSSGGTVYLLAGTYNLGAPITMNTGNVTLTGDTGAATLIRQFDGSSDATSGMIVINGGDRVTISNLYLDGNGGSYTNATYDNNIAIVSGSLETVSNTDITGSAGTGIRNVGANGMGSQFINNRVRWNNYGIWLDSSSDFIVSGNVVLSSNTIGIYDNGAEASIVNNTVSDGNGEGIYGGSTVTGNTVHDNGGNGIDVIGGETVSANEVRGNDGNGISITQGNDFTITNNDISWEGSYGIYAQDNGEHGPGLISNNSVLSSNYDGIYLDYGPHNLVVSDNTIDEYGLADDTAAYNGITFANLDLSRATGDSITGNIITDSAGAGYAIELASAPVYLANNTFSGTGAANGVHGSGTGTVLAGQLDASNDYVIQSSGNIDLNSSTNVTGNLTVTGSVAYQKGSDYSTTGRGDNVNFGTGALFRLTGASTQTITGIAGGTNGRMITLINAASQAAILSNNSTYSSAGNRITTGLGGDLTVAAGASVSLVYDSGSSVWRVVGTISGGVSGGSYVTLQGSTPGTADTGNINISGSAVLGGSMAVGTSGNTITLSSTNGFVATGTARHTKTIKLTAEYAGGVLDALGDTSCSSANAGTLTSGSDTSSNNMNYYLWSSSSASAQCYDVVVRVPIPSDFDGWASSTPLTIQTYTTSTSNGTLQILARDTSNTLESSCNYGSITPATASTWAASTGCTIAGTYNADGVMVLRIRMSSASGAQVRIGDITLSYKSKF